MECGSSHGRSFFLYQLTSWGCSDAYMGKRETKTWGDQAVASNIVFLEFSQATIRAKDGRKGFNGVGSVYFGSHVSFRFGCTMGSSILHNLPAYLCEVFSCRCFQGFQRCGLHILEGLGNPGFAFRESSCCIFGLTGALG